MHHSKCVGYTNPATNVDALLHEILFLHELCLAERALMRETDYIRQVCHEAKGEQRRPEH